MLPEQLHVIPVLDHAVLDGVPQLVEAPFIIVEFLADVGVELVARAGDHDIVFGAPDAELVGEYIEGNFSGTFYSPLNPTFM